MDFSLTEEQDLFRKTVREWVDREIPISLANEIEQQEHEYPHELWDKFSAAGFHGVGIDEEYGGQGGDIVTQMILMRELARSLAGLSWVWGISSFSGAKSVGMFGSEEQKQRFLPELASGDIKFAIAYTEPDGGTDVLGAMKTTAVRDGDGWRISGSKIWSTAAHVSDYLMLLARTDKNPEKKSLGTTVFLVPGNRPRSPHGRFPRSACGPWARVKSSSTMPGAPTRTCSARSDAGSIRAWRRSTTSGSCWPRCAAESSTDRSKSPWNTSSNAKHSARRSPSSSRFTTSSRT